MTNKRQEKKKQREISPLEEALNQGEAPSDPSEETQPEKKKKPAEKPPTKRALKNAEKREREALEAATDPSTAEYKPEPVEPSKEEWKKLSKKEKKEAARAASPLEEAVNKPMSSEKVPEIPLTPEAKTPSAPDAPKETLNLTDIMNKPVDTYKPAAIKEEVPEMMKDLVKKAEKAALAGNHGEAKSILSRLKNAPPVVKLGGLAVLGAGALAANYGLFDDKEEVEEKTSLADRVNAKPPSKPEEKEAAPTPTEREAAKIRDTHQKLKDAYTFNEGELKGMDTVTKLLGDLAGATKAFDGSSYEKQVTDIKKMIKEDKAKYATQKDREQNAQVFEKVMEGLLLIGAGAYGLKTGLNVSDGLEFKGTDWKDRLDRLQKEYESARDASEKDLGRVSSSRKEAMDFQKDSEKIDRENILARLGRRRDLEVSKERLSGQIQSAQAQEQALRQKEEDAANALDMKGKELEIKDKVAEKKVDDKQAIAEAKAEVARKKALEEKLTHLGTAFTKFKGTPRRSEAVLALTSAGIPLSQAQTIVEDRAGGFFTRDDLPGILSDARKALNEGAAPASEVETKIINGIEYNRTPGGAWKRTK